MRGAWTVTLGGRAHVSRPVSAEAVASFFDVAATGRVAETEQALGTLLRLAFPRPWYRRGGVAARVLDLPPRVRTAVVTALLTPPKAAAPARAADPWDALAAQNTAPEPETSGATLTIRHALAQCERFYGAGWAFNPARWGTADGGVPYPILWEAWHRMQAITALERLSATSAAARAQGGDAAAHAVDADVRRAYQPIEPAPVVADATDALRTLRAVVVEVGDARVVARPLTAHAVRRFVARHASRLPLRRRAAPRALLRAAFPAPVVARLMRTAPSSREAIVAALLAHYAGSFATEVPRGQ